MMYWIHTEWMDGWVDVDGWVDGDGWVDVDGWMSG